MTSFQILILQIHAAILAMWIIRHAVITYVFRTLHLLTPSSPRYREPSPPLVSAIIPAKDEEGTLADCLATVRAQSYPNLEILIVDDRSLDRTPEIARRVAEEDPRVRVITITDLPNGWTGKTHALQQASADARGEWFWFIDPDTRHEPDSLSIVMEYARAQGASLASLLPEMRCESFWEKAVQPLAGVVLMQSYPLFLVNKDSSRLSFANGQYILIERSAYEATGGHVAVRDKFVEDIHLARRVKSFGYSIRVAVAQGIGSTRMYTSLPSLLRGWSRILYDATNRNPLRLLGKALDQAIFSQSGHVALIAAIVLLCVGGSSSFAWTLLGMSVIQHLLNYSVLRRLYSLSPENGAHAVWYPLAGLAVDAILYRAIRMRFTGQISWRGTEYDRVVVARRHRRTGSRTPKAPV